MLESSLYSFFRLRTQSQRKVVDCQYKVVQLNRWRKKSVHSPVSGPPYVTEKTLVSTKPLKEEIV